MGICPRYTTSRTGEVLAILYSADVASKKKDLVDALVQLDLDQKMVDQFEANRRAVPEEYVLTEVRAVQGLIRARDKLRTWDIPQDEIDGLHAEAEKMRVRTIAHHQPRDFPELSTRSAT